MLMLSVSSTRYPTMVQNGTTFKLQVSEDKKALKVASLEWIFMGKAHNGARHVPHIPACETVPL